MDKYGNPDLSTWDRADRMDYLHHKAVKVILILAPDYYRSYAYPVIKERMAPKSWGNKKRAYCYELTYYYDARQEECADNNRLATVRIWKENGQPCTLSAGPFEIGNVFSPPHWKKQTEEDVRNGKEKLYPYAIFRWDGNTLY